MSVAKGKLSEADYRSVSSAALAYSKNHDWLTNKLLRAETGIGYDQAIWVLNRLVKERRLVRVGTGGATKYMVNTSKRR